MNIHVARAYVSRALLDARLSILPARQISKIIEHSIILIVRADTHKAHLSDSLRNLVLSDESRTASASACTKIGLGDQYTPSGGLTL